MSAQRPLSAAVVVPVAVAAFVAPGRTLRRDFRSLGRFRFRGRSRAGNLFGIAARFRRGGMTPAGGTAVTAARPPAEVVAVIVPGVFAGDERRVRGGRRLRRRLGRRRGRGRARAGGRFGRRRGGRLLGLGEPPPEVPSAGGAAGVEWETTVASDPGTCEPAGADFPPEPFLAR
jgi:hypothetical protein